MGNSVIEDIFNGTKGHRDTMPLTKAHLNILKEVAGSYDKLKKRFSEKQLKEIEKFLRVYDKNYCEEIDFYFKEGFKLGLRIAVECFEEKE